MGNTTSKKHNKHRRARPDGNQDDVQRSISDSSDDVFVDTVTKLDERVFNEIKKDLIENPELFVLNNMLMCVMFFENYQKEVQELSQKRYEKDEDCVSPDVLLENINRNVLYRPLHGPKKSFSEIITPKRLYVINDVVQVVNSLDSIPISNRRATVRVEESRRKGYVKLKEVETLTTPSIDDDILMAPSEPTPSTSRSSTDSDNYGYTTITDMKTPKPIEIIKGLEKQEGRLNIPPSCISYRKVRRNLVEYDLEDKEIENITEEDLFDMVSYVNSKGFMKFFQNNVFPNGVGTNLGFSDIEVRMAKSIPGKIFCSLYEDEKHVPCEVIPALSVRWPHQQTLQFLMKAQKPPEPRKRYIFPTQRMIDEIAALNCVLVPKGYVRKKGKHNDSDLEWEFQFPQAERYLETFLSLAQAKCLVFLLTLHKTYIEPKTSQMGLLTEHIRTFLLWECEANYSDWPEHRLGTKLVTLIKNLNVHIAKSDLRDFFIKERNLFENIPKKYLRHAQKVFHDILETPLMSFIKSLRNLRYTRGKFYYPFDFDKLYEILIKSGMESTNPQILSELSVPPNFKKMKYYDSDNQVRYLKEVQKREKILRKRQEESENANLKEKEERKGSVDSIDMSWTCDKQFDLYKTRALLTFFINNFIEIARECFKLSSHKQTTFYLKQARCLTRILRDLCPAFEEEGLLFINDIKKLEDENNMKAVKEDAVRRPVGNGAVKFASSAHFSKSVDNLCSGEQSPKVNGIVKPRKSVMFVEKAVNA
ncbi:hypothetical protein NQ315_013106 [Exocentrus adspersus]|uniref:Mab-21-like HhH/H2TH-like domain-containing protein n=1 Tax=Exocentrus adspersus TaxID=1586481 RepID=A0AAV8VW48_9CUCU|nr:hypothetical protein NQ315_013106 [Exocentrus adspersus]